MRALPDYVIGCDAVEILGRAIGQQVLLTVDVSDRDRIGNVLYDRVEELAGASDLGRRRLALRDMSEMLARDEKADEPERDEQGCSHTGALQQVRAQERRRRHVDRERAHEIVDIPLRARLQLVVARAPAVFARE